MDFLKKHFQEWQKTIAPVQDVRKKIYIGLVFPLLPWLLFGRYLIESESTNNVIIPWITIYFYVMFYLITILFTSQNISWDVIGANACLFSFFILKPLIYLHFLGTATMTPEQQSDCLFDVLVSGNLLLFMAVLIIFRKIFLILGR